MKSNYAASNMIVCAVGNIEHEKFVKMVEKRMANVAPKPSFVADKQVYSGGYFTEKRNNEQAQIVLGFEGVKYGAEDYYPTMLLASVLGGGMSSRLFKEIREKRGLVYSVYCFSNNHTQGGFLGISAATDKVQINKMMPVMVDEIKKASRVLNNTFNKTYDDLYPYILDYKEKIFEADGAVLTAHYPFRWEGVEENAFTATRIVGIGFHPEQVRGSRCRTCFVTDCPSRREAVQE